MRPFLRITRPDKPGVDSDADLNPFPGLPATLGQLVLLWEGIVLSCLDTIVEQSSANTWNKERNRDKTRVSRHQGSKEGSKQGVTAAANSPGIWQMCDICGIWTHSGSASAMK